MVWYNASWDYRRKIVVTNNIASALTNHQVLLTLDTASLVTAGKMQADGDDIIFADLAGVAQDYWIESGMNTNATKIWVEVKSVAASSTKDIYLYYGNAGAIIASNGDNTFLTYRGAENTTFSETTGAPAGEKIFEAKGRRTTAASSLIQWGLSNTDVEVANDDSIRIQTQSTTNLRYLRCFNESSVTQISETPTLANGIWYKIKVIQTNSNITGYIDGNPISTNITTNMADEEMGLYMNLTIGTGEQEFSFVRKYATTEPTHGAWGNEETNGGPAISVDVQYLPILTATIDTAITNARTGANNKYFNVPIVNDVQIMFIHISQ